MKQHKITVVRMTPLPDAGRVMVFLTHWAEAVFLANHQADVESCA